ncbi:nuclear protein [Coprinopsis cinerea AmutBmut pab1-1]|nr:nuclear protein [Coprinopsis cinerea AmutBmut pab1-1]
MSIGELSLFSRFFPFTPVGLPPQVQQLIETQHLPSYEKAISLAEHYFAQVSWLFRGVTRSQVIDDMIPIIYRRQMPLPGEHYGGPHDLALLFCIFSISSLIGESPSAAYGDHYYQIARAALALQPVLEKPTMVTVQVLHLMSMYNAMSGSADMGGESSMETTWSLITLASNLSQTIGLHRDSVRWGLSPKMVQRRRILFWDLFVADVWQSLNTGRPPSFSLAYVDCRHPQYEDGGKTFATEFESWQFRFAAEVVAEVAARTLTAEAPSYATIMELDRKVREYPIPETANSSSSSDDFSTAFQRCVYEHIRETVLLYIHRSFFAQAIIDHPENPLKSTYSPSFSAAYQASSTILKSVQEHFNMYPQSSSIFWTMWTFAFSAAVVFGTVVTRGPRSPLAKSAMRELEQACILFSKASVYSTRATKALQILKTLSEKARLAMSSSQNDPSRDNGLHWAIRKDDDELSIFAGHTRFVNPKHTGETPPSSDNGGNASPEYNSPPTVQAVSSMPPVPQVRQPQPVQSSYRFEASVSPDVRMDTSEPAWPSQAESYDAAPRPRPSDQYGYHSNAPMGPGPSAPVAEYWVNTARDVSAARYDGPQHPSAPRISRPLQPPPQDHGYYHPPSPGDSAPVSLRSSHYYPPQSQGYAPAMYSNRQASTHIGNAPLSASSTSSSGQPFDMHTHQQSHPHPAEPSTAHPHPHPAHAPSSHAHPTQSHAHSSTPTYTQQYSMYPTTPAFHSQAGPPANNALADLGFASRDSRLDEKWGMFMSESGILEEINFRPS